MGKYKEYNMQKYEDCLNKFIAEDLRNTENSVILETLIKIKNNQSSISQDNLHDESLKKLLKKYYKDNKTFMNNMKTSLMNKNYNDTELSINLLNDMCIFFNKTPNDFLQINLNYFQEIVYFDDNAISKITSGIFSPEKTVFKKEKDFFYEEFICRTYPFLGLSLKATYNQKKHSYSYIFFYSLSIKNEQSTDNDYFEHFRPTIDDTINSVQDIDFSTEPIYEEALLEFRKRALKVYKKYFSEKIFPLSETTDTYKTNATAFLNYLSTQIALTEDKQSKIDEDNCTNDSSYHNNKQNKEGRLDNQINNAKKK